jgi:ApbE superfamily uncharacterized protein (UPF0280 family)
VRERAEIRLLPDGHRLYLHDGPIDVILEAFGTTTEITSAYDAAARRFVSVLDELCGELSILRQPITADSRRPAGTVAKRMARAVAPYAARTFITPMAAVAGAVAEEILAAMASAAHFERAYVNDGGDIALHLEPGQQFVVGMIDDRPDRASLFGTAVLEASEPVRGIATSGWRGRSFSLGIADAVTVLADQAAMADAAATIIANAVDVPEHPNVFRVRARDIAPDNDLGDHLVTQAVGDLTAQEVCTALGGGETLARTLLTEGLIRAAALHLRGETRIVGFPLHSNTLGNHAGDRSLVHA